MTYKGVLIFKYLLWEGGEKHDFLNIHFWNRDHDSFLWSLYEDVDVFTVALYFD